MSFPSLLAELEATVKTGAPEKRVDTLRRVTGLFLGESNRLNEQQIGVFDDVLVHLIQRIESKALVELSKNLAPIDNAPIEVIRRLSRHDEIAVAGPVLTQSNRLSDCDLVAIAKSKGQGHLLAISGRAWLAEAVTDVLVDRGDVEVHNSLARNSGAQFASTANEVAREAVKPRNFVGADSLVLELNRNGKLTERVLLGFIRERKYEEMAATLALFCGAELEVIELLLKNVRPEGLIIACKAAKLCWSTTSLLLRSRFAHHSVSPQELAEAKNAFLELSQAAAQRSMRFMQLQTVAKRGRA